MITVPEALAHLFDLVSPLESETIPLVEGAGRVLARPAQARRNQPPFSASAMDGYAVKAVEVEPEAMFRVIGTSAAGHGFAAQVGAGEAVRIFTGAPVPAGADRVVIQEDVRRDGDVITLGAALDKGFHIRPAAGDFAAGDAFDPKRLLSSSDLALLASMNVPELTVTRKPVVALIATGDELVMPGEEPGPDQIIASNGFGLKALIEAHGGEARMLPIARDTEASLRAVFALAEGADMVVTIGGASVGDHDIVGKVAADLGMEQSFYKVAVRPGKPLMAGRMGGVPMLGLPGNPVSALVTARVFLVPALRVLLGLGAEPAPRLRAPLSRPLKPNGPREHYMRAVVGAEGIQVLDSQDSSLLSVLAAANALVIRPVGDGAREIGEVVEYLAL